MMLRRRTGLAAATALLASTGHASAQAGEPIRIGMSVQLTGGLAPAGKASLLAMQIWAEDVNARGGLLGRPVQLVFYDDQSSPGQVPGIYTKLIDIDRVDLLVGMNTNLVAPAMPTVMQRGKLIMAMFALAVNEQFRYPHYFQIQPFGPTGKLELSRGFFDLATAMSPKPSSIALVGADAEFAKNVMEGARAHARRIGLRIGFDRAYPPNTVDFAPIIRSIQSARPDVVFAASYPPDTVGLIRSVHEANLRTSLFGGAMVGTQYAPIKRQLGPLLNGIVSFELYNREPTVQFSGIDGFLRKYQARAVAEAVDPLGYYNPPFAYAGLEVLGAAVTRTGGLEPQRLAEDIRAAGASTIVGDIRFGADGEWAEPRILTVQFQAVRGSELTQFTQAGVAPILYPPRFASGSLRTPFPMEAS